MAQRRTSGEGTIYKLKSGKWRAQLSVNGKRLSRTGSLSDVKLWLSDQKEKKRKGYDLAGGDIPMSEYFDKWLITKSTSLKSSSLDTHITTIEKYLKPHLGTLKLKDVSPSSVQAMINSLMKNGVSAGRTRIVATTLKGIFDTAKKLRIIPYNPVDGVSIPRGKSTKKLHVWDKQQVSTYIAIAKISGDRLWAALVVAVSTGMRIGEICGLLWSDYDRDTRLLSIVRQTADGGGGYTDLKTESSLRTIRMPEFVARELEEHLLYQQNEFFVNRIKDDGKMFSSRSGDILTRRSLRYAHYKAIERSGLPKIRFHDLRHTALSLMLVSGVPVLEVSKYAGHAKVSMTLDVYGHLIPSMGDTAANAMDDVLGYVPDRFIESAFTNIELTR